MTEDIETRGLRHTPCVYCGIPPSERKTGFWILDQGQDANVLCDWCCDTITRLTLSAKRRKGKLDEFITEYNAVLIKNGSSSALLAVVPPKVVESSPSASSCANSTG